MKGVLHLWPVCYFLLGRLWLTPSCAMLEISINTIMFIVYLCMYALACVCVCVCTGECSESEGQVGELYGRETSSSKIGETSPSVLSEWEES